MKRSRIVLLAALVAANLLVVSGAASADTTEAIAETGGMTLELAVLGVPLDVSVALDEFGNITEVGVSDETVVEDKTEDHKVKFSNEDDTIRIDINAKKSKLKATVKTTDLAAITGAHVWSGLLFTATDSSQVQFDVTDDGSGNPLIGNVAVVSLFPAEATSEIGDVEVDIDEDEAESSVKVTFNWNGYEMTLKIKANVEFDDEDGDRPVSLKIELKGKDDQKLREDSLDAIVGPHMWDGLLCDGTNVAVKYTVGEAGVVTVDGVTADGQPTDAVDIKKDGKGFKVEFDDSKASVDVDLKQKDDGLWELKVKSKTTEHCKHDDQDDEKSDEKKDKSKDDDKKDDKKSKVKSKDDDDDEDDDDEDSEDSDDDDEDSDDSDDDDEDDDKGSDDD